MVSPDGTDESMCLNYSPDTSCRTIGYPIKHGFSSICLHGIFYNTSENIFYPIYEQNRINIFSKNSLSRECEIGLPCESTKPCSIYFWDVKMMQNIIMLSNVNITFRNVIMEETLIQDVSQLSNIQNMEIYFVNSTLSCFDPYTRCGLDLTNTSVIKVLFIGCYLENVMLNIYANQLILIFYETHISLPAINVKVRSYEYLRIPAMIRFHKVTVGRNMLLHADSKIPFKIQKNTESNFISFDMTNPYIVIEQSDFTGIHLEIQSKFYPVFLYLLIARSSFMNSYHVGNGGGLKIISQSQTSEVLIMNCLFSNNSAVNGAAHLKGQGGGLYVDGNSLRLVIAGCYFLTNSASDLGLALFSTEGVDVSISICTFKYSVKPDDPIQQSVVFVAGRIVEFQGQFLVFNSMPDSYVGPIHVFYIEQIQTFNIETHCPEWYNHNIDYTSVSGLKAQAYYKCTPCSVNYYTKSMQVNKIYYNENKTATPAGKVNDGHTGICMQCPYGALCTGNNVIPRPNYWGYWHEGELVFHQCPAGYSCSGTDTSICNVYYYCPGNRTGTLCGACEEGFSVSILTGGCTPDSLCGRDHWFWLVVILAAMAYAFWYTMKDDVFVIFFNSIRSMKNICTTSKANVNDVPITLSLKRNAP